MQSKFLLTAFSIVVIVALAAAVWVFFGTTNTAPITNQTTTTNSGPKVKIYLVKLNDSGQTGIPLGCGDSLVLVERSVAFSNNELFATLETLLTERITDVTSGLYNVFEQSSLSVDSAVIVNDRAVVKLSGNLQLGGICDDPRLVGQLQQTVLDVPGVVSADITINGQTLEEVTPEQG